MATINLTVAPEDREDKGWLGERYDPETNLQYLNARYYDPELGMFLQPDWFEVTKPGVGTNRYAYSFGDPVNKMDPGGNESITMIGQDNGHNIGTHFPENGLSRAQKMKQRDEDTTMLVHRGVSGSKYAEAVPDLLTKAQAAGINVVTYGNTDEAVNYMRTGTIDAGEDLRTANPVTNFSYVGHGVPGGLAPDYSGQFNKGKLLRPSDIGSSAFSSGANINLMATCNAAAGGQNSVVAQFSSILDRRSVVSGYDGRVDFYSRGVDTDSELGSNNHHEVTGVRSFIRSMTSGLPSTAVYSSGNLLP